MDSRVVPGLLLCVASGWSFGCGSTPASPGHPSDTTVASSMTASSMGGATSGAASMANTNSTSAGGATGSGGAVTTALTTENSSSGGSTSSSVSTTGVGAGGSGPLGTTFEAVSKPRVLVLTDISNEPDDEESLVRFLVYANEYDVEGLIATTSTHLRASPREDLIFRQLDAYEQVRENLSQHAPGYPTAELLRTLTATGQTGYSMDAVGDGLSSAGSDLIIDQVDAADERPLWIAVWGGANTLAQALWDVRELRSSEELAAFVAKLRIYSISDQDHAGPWLREQFPDLFYVVSPSDDTADHYAEATWSGISGDEHYDNGPGYYLELTANTWLSQNVSQGHGPLGALYPAWKYIMEGDTPSFLWLIDRGLGSSLSPSYGGWGGRYALSQPSGETREIWTNSADSFEVSPGEFETSPQATIWRFRPEFQYDFAARMDWCLELPQNANHNPIAVLNGDGSTRVLHLEANAGSQLELSAEGSSDPDANALELRWFLYPEAGSLPAAAQLSTDEGPTVVVSLPAAVSGTLHVILQAVDDGTPPLSSYRRAILHVEP